MTQVSIQEVARLLGVHPDTIRDWEAQGHIEATRTPGGHRRYDASTIRGFLNRSQNRKCLSRFERQVLADNAAIRAALCPNEADHWKRLQKALEAGYELEYQHMLAVDADTISVSNCQEVRDVLEMYYRLQQIHAQMSNTGDLTPSQLAFPGFDNTTEVKQWAYAQFVCEEEGVFEGLRSSYPDLSASMPRSTRYAEMLPRWRQLRSSKEDWEDITHQDIKDVLGL